MSWAKRKAADAVANRISRSYWAEVERLEPHMLEAKRRGDNNGPFGEAANYSVDGRPITPEGVRLMHCIAWPHAVQDARIGDLATEARAQFRQIYEDALAMRYGIAPQVVVEWDRAKRREEADAFVADTKAMWLELELLDAESALLLFEAERRKQLIAEVGSRFRTFSFTGYPVLGDAQQVFREKYGAA